MSVKDPDNRIPCRKCLLSELSDQALYIQVKKTIEAIPESARAPEDLVRYRLMKCKNCESLFQGMCRECGCYVEVRSARLKSRCPAAKPEW